MQSSSNALSSFLGLPIGIHLKTIWNLSKGIDRVIKSLRDRQIDGVCNVTDFSTLGSTLLERAIHGS